MNINKPSVDELAVATLKGLLGAIPLVGSLAAELTGTLIPNRRAKQLEKLVIELAKQMAAESPSDFQERFLSPEFADLFEEGGTQATRAFSDERITRIAALLKNSLTDAELRHIQDKRILELLGQLNDAEIIHLQSYTSKRRHDEEFQEQHEAVLTTPGAYIGAPQDVIDQDTMYDQFHTHLIQLGLLLPRTSGWKKGEGPQLDEKTGLPKVSYYDITELGRMLLRRIDLLGGEEY